MRRRVHGASDGEAALRGSTAFLLAAVLRNRSLRRVVRSFIATVAGRFFIDQFAYRLRLSFRPDRAPAVRNIEHPLDAVVPVRYGAVGVYLTFVKLWISALSYLRRRIGPSFDADIAAFLVDLERCYADAASVYGRCLSTTRRPALPPSPRFAMIYAADPHLFCVPSLHVLVVCYTYKRLEDLLRARGALESFRPEMDAVRTRAVAITESILYVRQHSVHCIPTALAMLSVIVPSYDATEARRFLSGLFAGDPDIAEGDRRQATDYMLELYDRLARSAPERRYDAIARFVASYEEMAAPEESAAEPEYSSERAALSETVIESGSLSKA